MRNSELSRARLGRKRSESKSVNNCKENECSGPVDGAADVAMASNRLKTPALFTARQ